MKASLVITSHNQKKHLEACLVSLNHQAIDSGDELEIIVVDDGSTDGTEAMVTSFPSKWKLLYKFRQRDGRSCRSAVRNVGLHEASGDVVLFVDGDHIFEPQVVKEHLRFHKFSDNLAVLGIRDYLADGEIDYDKFKREFNMSFLPPVEDEDPRVPLIQRFSENFSNLTSSWYLFWTCNVSVRRDQLLEIGGFDENFIGWGLEDVELGYRLFMKNVKFAFAKQAMVHHQYHPDFTGTKYVEWRDNLDYFQAKYPDSKIKMLDMFQKAFNHEKVEMTVIEGLFRLEYSLRALEGRLPEPKPYQLCYWDQGAHFDKLVELHKTYADNYHLIVVDETDHPELDVAVQTLQTGNELLYFRQPDKSAMLSFLQELQQKQWTCVHV